MPAPPPGNVLYRFSPTVTGDWDGFIEEYRDIHAYTTLSDAWDFTTWADGFHGDPENECGVYKYHQSGIIHRVRFTFSTDAYPYNEPEWGFDDWVDFLTFSFYREEQTPEPYQVIGFWLGLFMYGAGHLATYYPRVISTGQIALNTNYTIEVYTSYLNGVAEYQVYVNDELWLNGNLFDPDIGMEPQDYLGWCSLFAGYGKLMLKEYFPLPGGTVHIGDLVWTIESPGGPKWSMMALL